jgi:hypothetical protein
MLSTSLKDELVQEIGHVIHLLFRYAFLVSCQFVKLSVDFQLHLLHIFLTESLDHPLSDLFFVLGHLLFVLVFEVVFEVGFVRGAQTLLRLSLAEIVQLEVEVAH